MSPRTKFYSKIKENFAISLKKEVALLPNRFEIKPKINNEYYFEIQFSKTEWFQIFDISSKKF